MRRLGSTRRRRENAPSIFSQSRPRSRNRLNELNDLSPTAGKLPIRIPHNVDVDQWLPKNKSRPIALTPKAVNRPGIIPEISKHREALLVRGPKTPEGKAVSSQNASRYDLLAKSFVLRSECPARFQTFIDSFYAEFNPATPTEAELVDTMATARWRMIRMSNLEAAIIDHEYGVEPDSALTTPARATLAYRRATDSGRSIVPNPASSSSVSCTNRLAWPAAQPDPERFVRHSESGRRSVTLLGGLGAGDGPATPDRSPPRSHRTHLPASSPGSLPPAASLRPSFPCLNSYPRQPPRPESVLAPLRPPARQRQRDHQIVMLPASVGAHPHPAAARRCHAHIRPFSDERTSLLHPSRNDGSCRCMYFVLSKCMSRAIEYHLSRGVRALSAVQVPGGLNVLNALRSK
jgi:hypothetical protein